jgi:heme a synthase
VAGSLVNRPMTDTIAYASFVPPNPQSRNNRAVSNWLTLVALLIFALVIVGGLTRLTDSGLSITEWKPIHGVIPPFSESEWQEEFAKYQQIPEYQQINQGMELDAFKRIFWWEWAHRALARLIGVVFALPLAFLWLTGRLENHLKPKLLGLLALGALQGGVGWWMVTSGLTQRTDVSQYRLATHLTLASLIFAATIYVMRSLAPHTERAASASTRFFAGFLVLLVLVQIYLGGLVAGLDAGMAYNTWPLMDGAVVPNDLLTAEPLWRNFFENAKTVQFDHRMGAYLLFAFAFVHVVQAFVSDGGTTHARRTALLFLLVAGQAAVGIVTLLSGVHLHAAITHQGTALIVLAFAVAHWRGTQSSQPA